MDTLLEPLLLRHSDAQRALACGNSKYWELVNEGKIEVVGKGKMSRATYRSVKAHVEKLLAEVRGKAA
jgi:hypothetical protein